MSATCSNLPAGPQPGPQPSAGLPDALGNLDAAARLEAGLGQLPDKDIDFATSLLQQFERKGTLSAKQWYWVRVLAGRTVPPAQQAGSQPGSAPIEVGDFAGVVELFVQAKAHLKHPKIWLALPDGRPLVLALAGPASSHAGWVSLTDGKPFGQNLFYGRVSPGGAWEMGKKVDEVLGDHVAELMHRLAANPTKVAQDFGKLTGNCCFCGSGLSAGKSTAVGYGPVCAKRWGLPWGAA